MSENKTILTTRRFELWWRKAQGWFATQFASVKADLTPVKEKIDEVKEVTAKETTAQEIKELVLQEGIILGNEYAETINDIIGDWNNE